MGGKLLVSKELLLGSNNNRHRNLLRTIKTRVCTIQSHTIIPILTPPRRLAVVRIIKLTHQT